MLGFVVIFFFLRGAPQRCSVRLGAHLTSVPGEVEAEDGGAVVAQVLQGLQVLLQFPVGQLRFQERRQAAEDKGIKGSRPGEQKSATGSWALHPPSPPKATKMRPPRAFCATPPCSWGQQVAPPCREGSLLPVPAVGTGQGHGMQDSPVSEQPCWLQQVPTSQGKAMLRLVANPTSSRIVPARVAPSPPACPTPQSNICGLRLPREPRGLGPACMQGACSPRSTFPL